MKKQHILIGSTFPVVLIRRRVVFDPVTLDDVRQVLDNAEIHSFWGHANTLDAARSALGKDLTPLVERPALLLDDEGFPSMDGISFKECWVLSPNYRPGFRPRIGSEVHPDDIVDWNGLRISWE